MAESGSQGARERSRGPRGRSTTRGRSAASGQEVSRSRFERLESQVGHLSDTLLALGPALQQLVQLHAQPSTAAPNVGSPPVVMPAQMLVPPVRTVDPQVPTNAVPPNPNPESSCQAPLLDLKCRFRALQSQSNQPISVIRIPQWTHCSIMINLSRACGRHQIAMVHHLLHPLRT